MLTRRMIGIGGTSIAVISAITIPVVVRGDHSSHQSNIEAAGSGTSLSSSPADAAVRTAITKAITLHETMVVPPRTVTASGVVPNATALDALLSNGLAAVGASFGGNAALAEDRALRQAIATEQTGQLRVMGGGVTRLVINALTVNGDTATATATADVFSSIALKNPNGVWMPAKPKNTLDIDLGLQLNPQGRWVVDTFTWQFAGGTSP